MMNSGGGRCHPIFFGEYERLMSEGFTDTWTAPTDFRLGILSEPILVILIKKCHI